MLTSQRYVVSGLEQALRYRADMAQDCRIINGLSAARTDNSVAEVFKVRGHNELEIRAATIAHHDFKLRHLFLARLFNSRL